MVGGHTQQLLPRDIRTPCDHHWFAIKSDSTGQMNNSGSFFNSNRMELHCKFPSLFALSGPGLIEFEEAQKKGSGIVTEK